jgi:serine/threonine-protein kinase
MGEVYRARDTRLKRDVALKILPESFASDPDRLARFQREAEVLASLNHPNIAAIHGLEEGPAPDFASAASSGREAGPHVRALVMELVEGETLADRIARGSIPVDEALRIAKQITEALEAAHEQGIIHRDLKPANIKVRPDGTVKVLDFGLAKAMEPAGSAAAHASLSPTVTSPAMTQLGVILGTAAYMSPEQAKGRSADKRSDIWAFGCVLYEMLTGKRAFDGDDMTEVLGAVVRLEPDWTAVPAAVPSLIRTLLRDCLVKDPRQRVGDFAIARFALTYAADLTPTIDARSDRTGPRWLHLPRVAWTVAAFAFGAAVATGVTWFATRADPPLVTRLTIVPPSGFALTVTANDRDLALSPDGSRVAFLSNLGTQPQLFVRGMGDLEAIAVTSPPIQPRDPFFSPDGRWIGFFDGVGSLKKVAVTGGPSVTIARLDGSPRGGTWGDDRTIVFATNNPSGLLRVSEDGGTPAALTTPDRTKGEIDHLWPRFLPDGRGVLYTVTSSGGIDNAQVAVRDLRSGANRVLVRSGTDAHYLRSGHLVYGIANSLQVVSFDLDRLDAGGTPVPLVSDVLTTPLGAADFDVSREGTLVYIRGGGASAARTLVWVDRLGREEPLKVPARAYTYPRISPDGRSVAIDVRDQDNDVWIWDFGRETLTRFTSDPGMDRIPVWSPDGKTLMFSSEREGVANLFRQAASGTGQIEQLTSSDAELITSSISPDGSRLVYWVNSTQDLMVVPLNGDHHPQPLVQTRFVERNGEVSPDGRWLAYESDESGQLEVYVRPFPDASAERRQVSNSGGTRPSWTPTSRELFYLAPDGALMSVPVGTGPTWSARNPTRLFNGPYFSGSAANTGRTYDVSRDGLRFLMIKPIGPSAMAQSTIVVIQNWQEELKRLVPPK